MSYLFKSIPRIRVPAQRFATIPIEVFEAASKKDIKELNQKIDRINEKIEETNQQAGLRFFMGCMLGGMIYSAIKNRRN